jgi:O-antigen ligase
MMHAVPYMVVASAALLAISPMDKIVALIPFLGTGSESAVTIDYRQRLFQVGVEHILENPLFGSFDFLLSEQAQELKQGNGMIDLVNTFLGVGLNSGLVGLSLYCGFFFVVAFNIFKEMRNLTDKTGELHRLGQVLLSTLIGMLIVLVTVSSIYAIPLLTWCVAGLGVAYVRMLVGTGTAVPNQTLPA